MNEDDLWELIVKKAEYIGSGAAHSSDVWHLLAVILAFYKLRGTSPEQMINEEMKAAIDFHLED